MNFLICLFKKIFNMPLLTTANPAVLFEDTMLKDSGLYSDVETWGGERIAADSRY